MLIKSELIQIIDTRQDFEPADRIAGGGPEPPRREEQNKAERERQAALKEAYEKGFAEGVKAGIESEKARSASAVAASSTALRELATLRKKTLERVEPEILDLAVSIAEKIIQREVSAGRDVFVGVLKSAVRDILDREGIRIKLNPKDYQYVMEVDPNILEGLEGIKNPEFESDAGIREGGVVVETRFGEVDARIEKQLEEVRSAMHHKVIP
ncbi:MAG: FliH/SctL family protein [Syntrophales bacterium]|nr:FliH/SctL family protein [Syntrophales bacterium]MDD5231808.1 FliH/SctL family protein [Syntrophales bacterium]MDD5531210.1 FliH/SctL family protein [Syntrophales bacterium]